MNLRIWVNEAKDSADYSLLVQACGDKGEPLGTIRSINVDHPDLGERLRDIFQAYRMGTRFGKEGV